MKTTLHILFGLSSGLIFYACGGSASHSSSTSCTSKGLQVVFNPMYMGYDGTHTFQVPALVKNAKPTDVTWSASDESMVSLAPDPTTGGIMITSMAAGNVTITAEANGQCGTSELTITAAAEADDWHDGAVRYNDGIDLRPLPGMGIMSGNKMAACTNCHGETAQNGPFNDVSHTPEQTGGFSDADLDAIIRQGVVPPGGYFDTSIVSMDMWHSFHQWQMTDEELRGLVVYLRSLTPVPQMGKANFGGQSGN
jgi:hypothetical protein